MGVRRFDSVWDAIADTTEDAANLLRGRLSALVNIAAKLGQRVHVELEAA